jgi:hypothetical protein
VGGPLHRAREGGRAGGDGVQQLGLWADRWGNRFVAREGSSRRFAQYVNNVIICNNV